ncbi:MAG: 5'-nucleotidase C-terminal domain-containing protein [Pseudomonadota bacterium]
MTTMARTLAQLFEREPSSFYAVSGDLFFGPNLPQDMKGKAELSIWNHLCRHLEDQGLGGRILISAGNHEFDYGVPDPASFSSGLLCANLVTRDDQPYYVPYRIVQTQEGLKVGFLGLLMEERPRLIKAVTEKDLKVIPKISAVRRFLPRMGKLDLTVLMIHDELSNIIRLASELPPELGVDMILSGHNHVVLTRPLIVNDIHIFQAGAMNDFYGQADLTVEGGKIISLEDRIIPLKPTPLEHATMRVKEKVDQMDGKTVAILKQSLLGTYLRYQENSLGDFVTDAFRWATKSDVAMTNSGSLRMDCQVYPGEDFELKEGHLRGITLFQNRLVVGRLSGKQILKILEGDAVHFHNQVSGLTYKMDLRRPEGKRVTEAKIGGAPISLDRTYTLTHNSYCTLSENMKRYLNLKPGSVRWKKTDLLDYRVLIDYARHMRVIDYPSQGQDRIVIVR